MKNRITTIIILSILVIFIIGLSACSPPPTGGATRAKSTEEPRIEPPQPANNPPTPEKESPTASSSTAPSPQPVIETPLAVPPTTLPAPSLYGVKLIPTSAVNAVSDDDLVMAMTVLKVELGVRPELKIKDISRSGSGKDASIFVETELSSNKPLIAVINALLNRERFEGRLGDKVLFTNNDLRFVCKIPACAGVEDVSVCPLANNKYTCSFAFGIVLFNPASERIGDAVKGLPTTMDGNETIIAEPIRLYLNNEQIDYVYVPADTAGTPITDMTISGNASGTTPKEAQQHAVAEMDRIRDKMSKKIIPVEMKIVS